MTPRSRFERAARLGLIASACFGCGSSDRASERVAFTTPTGGYGDTGSTLIPTSAGTGGSISNAAQNQDKLPTEFGLSADAVLNGSCTKSTVQSKLLPANILFVLDRSGSMACNPPPITDSAACEVQPTRADPSKPSKWETTTGALLAAIKHLPGTASVGLSFFSNDEACGVNSTPTVPIQPNTAAQQTAIAMSLMGASPGGGTPIVGATILAYKHLHELALAGKITGNEFVVLITDGSQSEMCTSAASCTDAASCVDLLVNQEVPKAAGPGVGIRTFVIGVPGSERARGMLSQVAKQGGTAKAGCDPMQGNCHFDMTVVTDLGAALDTALTAISGQAISCELDLPQPTSGALDLNLVNVVYTPSDGSEARVLAQDKRAACDVGANGWQYGDNNRKIELCGETCKVVRSDGAARVDVVLGCPVIAPQ